MVLLATIPGIGKKTAERLVVEIYDKMLKLANEICGASTDTNDISTDGEVAQIQPQGSMFNEATDALLVLGYKQKRS